MKMIASTKLAKAQRAMTNGKQYGVANSGLFRYVSWGAKSHINLCRGVSKL
jgi:F0F1-type ATP synthase gamma subunit